MALGRSRGFSTTAIVRASWWIGMVRALLTRATPASPQLFAEGAQAHPDKIAVVMASASAPQTLTYRELDRRSSLLAQELIGIGVKPGDAVGLFMGRALETVVAMLGVLKARACFVPLDPAYPAERIRFMLEDVAPRVVLSEPESLPVLPSHAGHTLSIEPGWGSTIEDRGPDASPRAPPRTSPT